MEIEMLKIIGNSLNLSLAIEPDVEETYRKSHPALYVGGYKMLTSMKIAPRECHLIKHWVLSRMTKRNIVKDHVYIRRCV